MRTCYFLFLLAFCISCGHPAGQDVAQPYPEQKGAGVQPVRTLGDIPLPEGYSRVAGDSGSFMYWLRHLPLRADRTVYLFNGQPKPNQRAQYAVIDLPVGKKDLQQCADVVMRLRAEYLFGKPGEAPIAFMDYAGKWYTWKGGKNREAFAHYLENVFGWCGSASLERQMQKVAYKDLQPGDVLVQGGFPGHAMLVGDMIADAGGNKMFLLVQGYQPAQDMHIVLNPGGGGSPWFPLHATDSLVRTPEWVFRSSHLHRW